MHEFFSILIVAIALSMDTFSVCLSLGTANIEMNKGIFLSLLVGIMHFIMPLIGMILGEILLYKLLINKEIFLSIIFLILALKMLYDVFIESDENIELNFLSILLFAFSVSLDAFTTGIGIRALTNNIIMATSTFMITSFIFSISGILLGKYVNKKIGKLSTVFGIIILIIMAIYLII